MTGSSYPLDRADPDFYKWESARGTRYITGRLGGAKLTLLPGEPTEDGAPTWRLLIASALPRQAASDTGKVLEPTPRAARANNGQRRGRRSALTECRCLMTTSTI